MENVLFQTFHSLSRSIRSLQRLNFHRLELPNTLFHRFPKTNEFLATSMTIYYRRLEIAASLRNNYTRRRQVKFWIVRKVVFAFGRYSNGWFLFQEGITINSRFKFWFSKDITWSGMTPKRKRSKFELMGYHEADKMCPKFCGRTWCTVVVALRTLVYTFFFYFFFLRRWNSLYHLVYSRLNKTRAEGRKWKKITAIVYTPIRVGGVHCGV